MVISGEYYYYLLFYVRHVVKIFPVHREQGEIIRLVRNVFFSRIPVIVRSCCNEYDGLCYAFMFYVLARFVRCIMWNMESFVQVPEPA